MLPLLVRAGLVATLISLLSVSSAAETGKYATVFRRTTPNGRVNTRRNLQGAPYYLFTFGDSYTDTGFDPRSTLPSSGDIMGNPSNIMQNWVACLVNYYHSALTYSYNYGRSGATIDNSIIYSPNGAQPVYSQVRDSFVPLAGSSPQKQWSSANAIAGFFIGINDVTVCQWNNCNMTDLAPKLQYSYRTSIRAVYDTGVRNFFVLNLPPLEKTPHLQSETVELRQRWIDIAAIYNTALYDSISAFQSRHPDTTILFFHNRRLWENVLSNYAAYGFNSITEITSNYYDTTKVWINDFHPGHGMHKIVASALSHELYSTFGF